jgi:hypothetical protein
MLEFSRRLGHWEWALQHLQPECRRRVQVAKPDANGGPALIVRVTRHWFPTDEELLEELDQIERQDPQHQEGMVWFWWERSIERGDPPELPSRLLRRWLQQAPTLIRFKIVAHALRERGTRKNLDILRNERIEATPDEVEAIVKDVEFAVMRRSLD